MSKNEGYVPPKIETFDASQLVASLGPASAGGSNRIRWSGFGMTPMGD